MAFLGVTGCPAGFVAGHHVLVEKASHYFFFLADALKALAVGAPLLPGILIFSPEPFSMRSRLAWILAYRPFMLPPKHSEVIGFLRHPSTAFAAGLRARPPSFRGVRLS